MTGQPIFFVHPSRKILGNRDNLHTRESLTPSLGLASLCASVRQAGFSPVIIDLRLAHRTVEGLCALIREKKPLFIGITAFTNEMPQAVKTAEVVRALCADLPILIGGPHASALPLETLRDYGAFSIAVVGEAEDTVISLARRFQEGPECDLNGVQGIVVRKAGRFYDFRQRDSDIDINALPMPAWDCFEIEHYNKLFVLSTSRGCPYSCYFCSPNYLGKTVRVKEPLKVVDEIEYLVDSLGARNIQFGDATLSLWKERTAVMCHEIIKRGLHKRITWDCETRADSVSPELLRLMRKAGCRWIAMGVETGSEKILRNVVKKGETKQHMEEAIRLIKRAGLGVRCFFIIGHCGETSRTIRETIQFALQLNPDALSFGLMVPNPGSEIRKLAEAHEGGLKIVSHDWSGYNQFDYQCMELDGLPLAELKKWQSKAYFTFYAHHPLKACAMLFSSSAYNYTLVSTMKIFFRLLMRILGREKS